MPYLAAAFKAGLGDGINPCILASVLIFIVYLSFFGETKRRIFVLGLLYVFAAVRMQEMITAGLWDGLLIGPLTQRAINIIYLFLSAGFSVLGVLNFLDWRSQRFSSGMKSLRLKTPAFLRVTEESTVSFGTRSALRIILIAILAFLIGAVVTLLAAIYPQTEYIYIVYSFLVSGGDKNLVRDMFFYYSVATALPLIITWVALMLVNLLFKGRENVCVLYNGAMAALYCSGGLGLGYFALQNIFGPVA